MTDFTKILDKAKELESKMKESQKKIKRSLMDEAKNSKIYKDVIKNFPDAELIDINLKGEEESND